MHSQSMENTTAQTLSFEQSHEDAQCLQEARGRKMRRGGPHGNGGFGPGRGGFRPAGPQEFQGGWHRPPGSPWGFGQGPGFNGRPPGGPPFGCPPPRHPFPGPGFAGPPPMGPPRTPPMKTQGPNGPFQGQWPRPPNNFNNGRQGQKRPWGDQPQAKVPQKKQKVDKRDLPENNKFVCESCDRGYATLEKYQEHVATHVKCKVEGCSYVAAAKLVDLHFQWQHRTGLAKKIWQLESKEDLEKWKQERRKNYPTPENIAKKKAVWEEKKARGEVIENKYFGKMRGRGRGRDRGRGRGRGRYRDQQERPQESSAEISNDQEIKKTSVPENPLDALIKDSPGKVSDDDETVAKVVEPQMNAPLIEGGLGSLMANYGTEESEEEGEIKDDPDDPDMPNVKTTDQTSLKEEETAPSSQTLDLKYSENQETNKPERGGMEDGEPYRKRNRGRKRNNQHIPKQYQHPHNRPYSKPTLLEQLLAVEIRRERNLIMQCVRHVVNTDFLGVGCLVEKHKKTEAQGQTSCQEQIDNSIRDGPDNMQMKETDTPSSSDSLKERNNDTNVSMKEGCLTERHKTTEGQGQTSGQEDSIGEGQNHGQMKVSDTTCDSMKEQINDTDVSMKKPVHKIFHSSDSSDSEDSGVTAF